VNYRKRFKLYRKYPLGHLQLTSTGSKHYSILVGDCVLPVQEGSNIWRSSEPKYCMWHSYLAVPDRDDEPIQHI
jgi:hypothetical protein